MGRCLLSSLCTRGLLTIHQSTEPKSVEDVVQAGLLLQRGRALVALVADLLVEVTTLRLPLRCPLFVSARRRESGGLGWCHRKRRGRGLKRGTGQIRQLESKRLRAQERRQAREGARVECRHRRGNDTHEWPVPRHGDQALWQAQDSSRRWCTR